VEGTQIGSYRIERRLGQGGFGVVYVGVDVRLGRRAAIKQLLPELSGHRDIVERFFNEAKAAASINHPGIVEIYDVGWHTDGSAYFAMKLLEGDSLAARLRATGPMPVQLAATIARQISSALVAAHTRGIVHRDLKPDNVVLVPDDEVAIGERATVLDFGIAKLFGDKPLSQKTRTGMMMGTPSYMSPEQCRGAGEVDHRTDVYALGCILFEMLSGRPPFVAEGAGEVLGMHQFVDAPALRSLRPDVPVELEAIVMRALSKRPELRLQQMSEVTAALQPFAAAGARSMEHAAQRPSAERPPVAPTVASVSDARNPPPIAPTVASVADARDDAVSAGARAAYVAPQQSTFSAAGGEIGAAPSKPRRMLPIVLGGGLLAAGAIILAVAMSSRGPTPNQAAAPADASLLVTLTADATRVESADAAVVVAVASTPGTARVVEDVPQLDARARRLVTEQKWDEAIDAAAAILKLEPTNAAAQLIATTASAESTNAAVEQELIAAIDKMDAPGVKAAYAKIPNTSVYKPSARTRHDKFVAGYVANARRHARSLASKHKCSELTAYGVQAGRVFPAARQAVDEVQCEAAPAPVANQDVEQLMQEAKAAAINGQYALALRTAETVLAKSPGHQIAITTAAIAACNLKHAGKAKQYLAQLQGQRQGMVRQVCLRNNVTVD